ncbi:hypothetical protein GW943_01700 [Candidatus Parcubacteria bacterium]|uniref:Uncharacterized protein n=1 Tax=Candidatus Kaiserbacteria bacterium CG10_big_fil_rev_8_21_14_0_10_47_16 TaxID=1974608 RepID=A0A2H0UED4_9BACT|nr:hypothetical protein [Candidatus Parcubacteria bacterium]PIR84747.1 MAG: hypothetical protein COU16_00995 [Candidatus Kaiserbacteria bacterium CG10_big_fil_rev_8_21_14_0_10_47_16]
MDTTNVESANQKIDWRDIVAGVLLAVFGALFGALGATAYFGDKDNYVHITDSARRDGLVYDLNKQVWRQPYLYLIYMRDEKHAEIRMGRFNFPVTYTTTPDGTDFCVIDTKKGFDEGKPWCTHVKKKFEEDGGRRKDRIELLPTDVDPHLYEKKYYPPEIHVLE